MQFHEFYLKISRTHSLGAVCVTQSGVLSAQQEQLRPAPFLSYANKWIKWSASKATIRSRFEPRWQDETSHDMSWVCICPRLAPRLTACTQVSCEAHCSPMAKRRLRTTGWSFPVQRRHGHGQHQVSRRHVHHKRTQTPSEAHKKLSKHAQAYAPSHRLALRDKPASHHSQNDQNEDSCYRHVPGQSDPLKSSC